MTTLDPLTAKMFPTLATYARRVRRREILALIALTVSAYIIGRDMLSAYQLRVAQENMAAMVTRVAGIEDQYQRDHQRSLVTTRAQAAVLTAERERRREQAP